MKLEELGEFGLIEKIRSLVGSAGDEVIKGIGDDCAVIGDPNGKSILLTTDILIEGVHFKKESIPAEKLGRKALAVNISDIAAMGGVPLYAVLTLAAPRSTEVKYIDGIIAGIISMADETGIRLVGGDTSSSPRGMIIDVALIGEAPKDAVLYRSGASAGQSLFLTGELGASAAGLDILNRGIRSEKYAPLIDVHFAPRAHIKEAAIISSSGHATSLIDISDGLIADLDHICRESKVGAILQQSELPISEKCREYCSDFKMNPMDFALYGGEDYVLLGTVPEHSYYALRDRLISQGCAVYHIGKTTVEQGIRLQGTSGPIREVAPGGYDHFKDRTD